MLSAARGAQRVERSVLSTARGAQRVERSAWSAANGAQRLERSAWSAARRGQRVGCGAQCVVRKAPRVEPGLDEHYFGTLLSVVIYWFSPLTGLLVLIFAYLFLIHPLFLK